MATYNNDSIGDVMKTEVSKVARGFELSAESNKQKRKNCHSGKTITTVDIMIWGINGSAGCAGNHGIAMREGAEVTMSR